MNCSNCGHPATDHVTLVMDQGEKPIVTTCYYPIHRNFDCPCAKFEKADD